MHRSKRDEIRDFEKAWTIVVRAFFILVFEVMCDIMNRVEQTMKLRSYRAFGDSAIISEGAQYEN